MPSPPALDVAGHRPGHRDHGLDRVGRLQSAEQTGAEVESAHRQRLVQTLAQTGRGAGVIGLELRGQSAQIGEGAIRALAPCAVQLAADEGALVLSQMVENIPTLVRPTPMDQGMPAEARTDRRPDALAPSITIRHGRSGSRPRRIRSLSRRWQTARFSVLPSTKPSGCL